MYQYATKLKAYPSNPAYDCVFNPYDKQHDTIQPFGLRVKFVVSSDKSKFRICSDSLSCLLAIESRKTQNPFYLKNC